MDKEQREILKKLVDEAARKRKRINCDPEHLTEEALSLDEQGYPEMASAIRKFRDQVVNPLMGEGWTIERIETVAERVFKDREQES